MQLFRQQVLDNRRPRLEGEVIVLPRLSHGLALACLLMWVAACGWWLANSEFTRKESVRGWLSPRAGVVRVYTPLPGRIKQLLVQDGDRVSEGEPLVIINGDHTLASGESLEALLMEEFSLQREALQRQLLRHHARLAHRHELLQRERDATARSLALAGNELTTLGERQQLLASAVRRYRALAQGGHLAHAELDDVTQRQLALDSARQALLRTRTGLEQRLAQLQIERELLPGKHDDTVDSLNLQISDISQRMARLRGNRTRVITAPANGTVNNLQLQVGQQASQGIPLLTIVPNGEQLQAQLLVPVRAAGFVRPGQQVRLRYDAFPYQKFGLFTGTIERVSTAVQLPGEVRHAPIANHEAAYRVSASLQRQQLHAYGRAVNLRPGMTFSADIRLGSRSLLEWLLEPLYSMRGRA